MEIITAQFSIKFPRKISIRRETNNIEDILRNDYEAPQVFSLPDDFAADAPRLLFMSKSNHSKIIISQISIDLEVIFDNDFMYDFKKTKEYVRKKINLLIDIADAIGIDNYCYCGLAYSINIDYENKSPIEYMENKLAKLGQDLSGDLYDASWSKSYADGDLFVNERVGINRKFEDTSDTPPDLIQFGQSKILEEKIGVFTDINDRRRYVEKGKVSNIGSINKTIDKIYGMMEKSIEGWNEE